MIYDTIDLHGCTTEDAMEQLTKQLDNATLRNIPTVHIVHGHGAGVLKKAVRRFLKQSCYVSSFRPGHDWEGGDGVTVATLK